jgi:hypothetical protein
MERFKFACVMIVFLALWSCKKDDNRASIEIAARDVYITSVQARRVDIVYKLSNLGYKETGVSYYSKDRPAEQHNVIAIRKDEQFKLSLQNLEPNTEYGFKVYYKTNEGEKKDEKEFVVKTLSATSLKFNLQINSTEVVINDSKFEIEIEGDYLSEINLSELKINVNYEPASISYPIRIAGQRYKMAISGQSKLGLSGHLITASYKDEEILSHYIPAKGNAGGYMLTAKAVNMPHGWYSVYKNTLYSFFEEKVLRWDVAENRLVTLRSFDHGFVWGNIPCFEFDNQMFFVPFERTIVPDPTNINKYEHYPEIVSYSPEANMFNAYPLLDRKYEEANLTVESGQYFIHQSEMYLAFTLSDLTIQLGNKPRVRTNFIYKYNRSRKQFEYQRELKTDILSYHFTSINNQLYLVGLIPVTDQGFKLSATFGAFKVSDTFDLEQIYTAGTLASPIKFLLKGIAHVDNKILIVANVRDFMIFDPINRVLHQVNVLPGIPGDYYNGLFTYNNMLHINIDAGFTSQAFYELTVSKDKN